MTLKIFALATVLVASCHIPNELFLPTPDAVDSPPIDSAPVDSDAATATEFLSCIGLPTTCGSGGNDICCKSLEVPGGSYFRSYDLAGDTKSGNTTHPATISRFRLDKYEVTVGRFRAFVSAGMGTRANPPMTGAGSHGNITGSGWDANWSANLVANSLALMAAVKCDPMLQTWTDDPGGPNEHRPMNCITWYEAMAFCVWDGGYLPTEAEWNYAAAGGPEQRAYPWSSPASSLSVDGAHASYDNGTGCIGDGVPDCAVTDLVPVGIKFTGNGLWGHSDLAGNVLEWTLDWFASYTNNCTDCANLIPGVNREVRGGNFAGNVDDLRTGVRVSFSPSSRNTITGARCARGIP